MRTLLGEDFLLSLLDASVDGILAFDRECRYTAWNRAMERISGFKRSEVLGRNAFELFPFLKQIGADQYYFSALAGKPVSVRNLPYTVPETHRHGFYEGRYLPLEINGEVVGGIGIIHDTTEQKLAEEASREAHQRLTFLVENSPLAVIEWDSDFRVSRWSESAERLFGWRAEDVLGKHVLDWKFVLPEDLEAVEQVRHRQSEGFERQGFIYNRNFTKDGSILHCEWYNSVLIDSRGKLVSVLSLVLDVTARKLAEDERRSLLAREREARRHAEDADRLKDEFLATLSHELRTPLTAVLGWASLIRSGEIPETEQSRAIEIIERNARSQARLIDDLLDVSRIITGNLHLELRQLDLASIVEVASDGLRPTAAAKGIRLQLEFEKHKIIVNGDPNRLRQVVWNLLLNAIKFTPRGGSVFVKVDSVESQARLVVRDTGDGISPQFLPYVFDRFRQAEGSISRKQGGLGLGLAVARHLVELHAGSVQAESEGLGKGATFTVNLPLASISKVDVAQVQAEELDVNKIDSGTTKLSGLRVLVVEDDDDSRALIGTVLKRQGADVMFASSTVEATDMLKQKVPDVLISDIGMPDRDGYELVRWLRSLPPDQGGGIPAIALTGYATARDRERAIAEGYQRHIAKPVEPVQLVEAIAQVLARQVDAKR